MSVIHSLIGKKTGASARPGPAPSPRPVPCKASTTRQPRRRGEQARLSYRLDPPPQKSPLTGHTHTPPRGGPPPPQKNRSLPTVLLYALTCDFTGGCPPPPSRSLWKKRLVNLKTCQLKPEKAMAPHSSTLAWKIPWTEEPGRLQSMGSQRVGHN